MITRAVQFLQKYRVLEGLLERRYFNRKNGTSSPVIEYMHDADSEPVRTDLNLLREIRNILSHNSDSDGDPVVEPSEETLDRLDEVIAYVTRLRRADQFGTDAEHILYACPDDLLVTVMRKMHERGFSHVPIMSGGRVCGMLTLRSVFDFVADNGINSVDADVHVRALQDYTSLRRSTGETFMFVSADTDIASIRKSFNRQRERNRRLALIMVTEHGLPTEPLIRLLTPWDAIPNEYNDKGEV